MKQLMFHVETEVQSVSSILLLTLATTLKDYAIPTSLCLSFLIFRIQMTFSFIFQATTRLKRGDIYNRHLGQSMPQRKHHWDLVGGYKSQQVECVDHR